MAIRRIYYFPERCQVCKACQVACLKEHDKASESYLSFEIFPFIDKVKWREDLQHTLEHPLPHSVRCIHCDEPECLEACPSGAIRKDPESGRVSINEEKCTGCWMCVMNCSKSAIIPLYQKRKALKCDHCVWHEKPACVRACPTKALVFCTEEEYEKERRIEEEKYWMPKEVVILK